MTLGASGPRGWGDAMRILLSAGLLVLLVPAALCAQTFQGRVVDEADNQPVPTALVRLVAEDGEQLAVSIADSSGAYRLRGPGPGTYRLEATRLGYENVVTPLLEAARTDGVYPVDLVTRAEPLPLSGLTVETRVTDQEADRQIERMIGVTPASMRYHPIRLPEIQSHLGKSHSLTDVLRWGNLPSLGVRRTEEGPCYFLRGGACLTVYLNGLPVSRDFIENVPLDMLYTIVVVTPTDVSMTYPQGAVLLYTEVWLR